MKDRFQEHKASSKSIINSRRPPLERRGAFNRGREINSLILSYNNVI